MWTKTLTFFFNANTRQTRYPKNVLICMISFFHPSDNTAGKTYIMMEARLVALFKTESEYTVLDK